MRMLLICMPYVAKGYHAPQIGVYRLQTYLRRHGFACDIFSPSIDDIDRWRAERQEEYDIIGVSGGHPVIQKCTELVAQFQSRQNKKALLMAGGIGPTNDYATWLAMDFDLVCLGYGEKPLLELCAACEASVDLPALKEKLATIRSIAYIKDGQIVKNNALPLTEEFFREITFINPQYDDIPYEKYWEKTRELFGEELLKLKHTRFFLRTVRITTNVQCANRCGYCSGKFISAAQGAPVKIFTITPEEIVELIKLYYNKYKCDLIFFSDDDFLYNKANSKKLCQLIINEKKNKNLPDNLQFDCQSRVRDYMDGDEVDIDFIHLLFEAGFYKATLGVESFSERLLKTPIMNKAQYNQENLVTLINAFQQVGLRVQINFMILIPETTREEIIHNLTWVLKLIHLGAMVHVTPKVAAAPGAPALKNDRYIIATEKIVSALNGKSIDLPVFFLPERAEVREVFENYDEVRADEEQKFIKMLHKKHANYTKTHNSIINSMALLKAMDEKDLYREFEKVLNKVLEPA